MLQITLLALIAALSTAFGYMLRARLHQAAQETSPPIPPFQSTDPDPERRRIETEAARTRYWLFLQKGYTPEKASEKVIKWANGKIVIKNNAHDAVV
jgi:hypothetical protein